MAEKAKSFAAYAKGARWEKGGLRSYFAYRDLASRTPPGATCWPTSSAPISRAPGPMGYHSHTLDFQMVYLVKAGHGSTWRTSARFGWRKRDAWYQAPGVKHEVLEYSEDWQVIEITMPADFPTHDEPR